MGKPGDIHHKDETERFDKTNNTYSTFEMDEIDIWVKLEKYDHMEEILDMGETGSCE
jgi:hypothetical protein